MQGFGVMSQKFLGYSFRLLTKRYRSNCYEIVGFDFLVDQDMQPWLLEINHAPDLEPYTSMETEAKRMAIRGK